MMEYLYICETRCIVAEEDESTLVGSWQGKVGWVPEVRYLPP